MKKSNQTAVAYTRVSTNTQIKTGNGIKIQMDNIRKYCKAQSLTIAASFTDRGESGATLVRPGIQDLMDYCKANAKRIDYVIADTSDRFARGSFPTVIFEEKMRELNIRIVCASQPFLNDDEEADSDNPDPSKALMRNVIRAFAEYEREVIKQRLAAGLRKKAEGGDRPTGKQAFGYQYATDERITVINETEARIVRLVFAWRLDGMSLQAIASCLNADSVISNEQRMAFSPHNQNRTWTYRTISVMLKNDYYTGVITCKGKKMQGNHEPIIDRDTWERVNAIDLGWRGAVTC